METSPPVSDAPLLRRTLDAIGEAVIATDLHGTVTLWNAAAERLYGWAADEALGANIVDLTPSSASQDEARAILERLRRGETWRGRFEVRRRDGTTFPALVTDAPLLDDRGRLVGIIGVSADLTDQLEAEASARRGELQIAVAQLARAALDVLSLDALFEQAIEVVAQQLRAPLALVGERSPSDGRIARRAGRGWRLDVADGAAPPWHRLDGAAGPLVVEDHDREDHDREDLDSQPPVLADHGVKASIEAAIGGRPGGFGVLGVYDTEPRQFGEDQVAFVESVAGVLGGAVARRAVEDELRRLADRIAGERRRYRELFRLAPDPYLVTDLHGVIIEANRRARVLLNTERPEGTTLTTYVASEAGLLHWMRDTARGGRTAARDVTLAPRDGPALIVRASVVRGAAVDATPVLRWVLHDVTDARRSQRALQAAFAEAHEEVAHMRDVDEWKNVMLTAAAHDLHSPLSAILVAAKTALERPDLDTVTRRTLLEDVRGHARRAQTLLSNLLDLDRLTRGVVRAEREPCRLDVLVTDAVDAAAVTDHPVTTDARRVEAMVDPTQLRQMVTNLVVNAAQHTPAGTPVHVAAWADGETVRITVDDEGPGLPGDLRDVFAPFVTAPRHSNDAAGTGIGLSLVKLFADLHDGVVHAENRPKGGARFTIELRGCVLSSGVR